MKKFIMLIVLVFGIIAFAACGAGAGTGGGGGEAAAPQQAPQGQPAVVDAGATGRTVNAHIFHYKVDTIDELQNLANMFAAQFEGADVTITIETIGGGGDYEPALAARFAAGDVPDIFALSGANFVEMYKEHIVDLTDDPWIRYTVDGLLDQVTFNGRVFAQPLAIEAYGYIFNVDLFEQVGITQAPTTFSELVDVAERLYAGGIRPFSSGYGVWWVLSQHFFNATVLSEMGLDAVSRVGIDESFANHPRLLSEMMDLLHLTTRFGGNEAALALDYNTSVSDFAAGRTAIIQQGTWIQPLINELNPDMRIGIFGFLTNDGPNTGLLPVGNAGYWVVYNNSDYVDVMRDFLTFMATDEAAINSIVNDFMFIPAFTGADYDLSTLGSIFAALQPFIEEGRTSDWVWPALPPGFGPALFSTFQEAAIGRIDLETFTAEIDSIIADMR